MRNACKTVVIVAMMAGAFVAVVVGCRLVGFRAKGEGPGYEVDIEINEFDIDLPVDADVIGGEKAVEGHGVFPADTAILLDD